LCKVLVHVVVVCVSWVHVRELVQDDGCLSRSQEASGLEQRRTPSAQDLQDRVCDWLGVGARANKDVWREFLRLAIIQGSRGQPRLGGVACSSNRQT
jgi:hypothetical protein